MGLRRRLRFWGTGAHIFKWRSLGAIKEEGVALRALSGAEVAAANLAGGVRPIYPQKAFSRPAACSI